jgi:hypothetical protein
MRILGLNKSHATYTIMISGKDYHIKLSSDLNNQIKNIYKKIIKKIPKEEKFLKEIELSEHFSFFQIFKTSVSIYTLEKNPYFSKTLKNKIKKEVHSKVEKEVLKNLKYEIKNPKMDYYVYIKYDKNGESFFSIKESIKKDQNNLKKEYLCKDKNVFIFQPKITITSIEEDFYTYKVHWNFKYPITIISTIGMDMDNNALNFINRFSKKQFKSIQDVYILNFLVYKGSINDNQKEIEKKYGNKIQFLTNKNAKEVGHTMEHFWILDLSRFKTKKTKETFINNVRQLLFN